MRRTDRRNKTIRRDLQQRLQHECTQVHLGMRNRQRRLIYPQVSVQQHIQIQRTRRIGKSALATMVTLNVQQFGKQLQRS